MSYILGQIVICLLIAGLIGTLLGWLLRGGCSGKLKDCEDEWKLKMEALENDFNNKFSKKERLESSLSSEHNTHETPVEEAHLKSVAPSQFEMELKRKLQIKDEVSTGTQASASDIVAGASIGAASLAGAAALSDRGISLSDEKASLYEEHGIDLHHASDLEDDYELHTLEGIESARAEKLKNLGIHSTKDFVKLGSDAEATQKVSQELGVDSSTVESWIGKSCLLELPGVNSKTADMMHQAGVTPNTLRNDSPETIHGKLTRHNQSALLPIKTPDTKTISLWSKLATPMVIAGAGAAAAVSATQTDAKDVADIDLSAQKIKLYQEHGINLETTSHLIDNYDIQEIEGVDEAAAHSLKGAGIHTTQELVSALYNNHDKLTELAKSLDIAPKKLSSWVSKADLMQLPGVNANAATLMNVVGISSSTELGFSNIDALHQEITNYNDKASTSSEVPSIATLTTWAKIAKQLS